MARNAEKTSIWWRYHAKDGIDIGIGLWVVAATKFAGQSAPLSRWSHVPDNKVHGTNMGPIWGRQDPGGPMLVPWTLLSGVHYIKIIYHHVPCAYKGVINSTLIMYCTIKWHHNMTVFLQESQQQESHGTRYRCYSEFKPWFIYYISNCSAV